MLHRGHILEPHARPKWLTNHGERYSRSYRISTNLSRRGQLTSDEQSAYVDAELCLMAAPSQLDVEGTQTRWDDLHWNHIVQTNFIHDVVGQYRKKY